MKRLFRSLFLSLLLMGSFSDSRAQASSAVLECMGSISSLMIYNTYVTIGSIADMYTTETIKKDHALELCSEQVAMLEVVRKAVKKVLDDNDKGALGNDDKAYIKDLSIAIGHLKEQAANLEKYLNSGNESDAQQYQKYRKAAWNKIAQILDLEE